MRPRLSLFFLLAAGLAPHVFAQDAGTAAPAPAPAPPAFRWDITGDAYSAYNPAAPESQTNNLRAFDVHDEAFRLNAAVLSTDWQSTAFGAHVELGYGDQLRISAVPDKLRGLNVYSPQYYVSYRPIHDSGLQLDFGRFNTSVGAEVVSAADDFNYSRSLLFALGEPGYHFGLRLSAPLSKKWSAGVQLLNGWNSVVDNNAGKTLGFTTTYTAQHWGWAQAILVGPEKDNTNAGKRQLYNQVFTLNPTDKLQVYVEALYALDKRVGRGSDDWYGGGVAARFRLARKWSIAGRSEFFNDQTGFTTGTAQLVRETTATGEYTVNRYLRSRLELRQDLSDRSVFERGQNGTSRHQNTILIAFLFTTRGDK